MFSRFARARAKLRQRTVSLLMVCAAMLALSACDLGERSQRKGPAPSQKEAAAETPDIVTEKQPSAPPQALTRAPLVSAKREIMGTWWELKAEGVAEEVAKPLLEQGLAEIERLEVLLSEWRPDSEVSQLNEAAGNGRFISVGKETYDNLKAGLEASTVSDGAFDVTWAAMRGLYRFEPGGDRIIPRPVDIERARALIVYRDLELKEAPRRARLKRKGMAVGLGGIAKGYALDRVSSLLEQGGVANYLLFAGGQVQVHGSRGGRPWRIGIKHPRSDRDNIGFLELNQGSVSTSGDYEHYFIFEGRRYHHIIDPKTGWPATRSVQATVIAPKGVDADALSTACFVKGYADCFAMLARLPYKAQAVVIDPELRAHVSPGFEPQVFFTPPLPEGGRLHPPSGS